MAQCQSRINSADANCTNSKRRLALFPRPYRGFLLRNNKIPKSDASVADMSSPRFGHELLEDRPFAELPVFPEAVIRQLNDPPAISKRNRAPKQIGRTRLYPASGTQQLVTKRRLLLREVSTGEQFWNLPLLTMQGFTVEQTKQSWPFYDSAKAKGWTPQGSRGFAPLQFPLPCDPLPQLPDRCVPPTLRPWLNDVAYRMDVPLDYLAAACLVAASSIIGRRAVVRPKVNDPWEEHANLWGLVIAQPGELKSPSIATALKPIEALERQSARSGSKQRSS